MGSIVKSLEEFLGDVFKYKLDTHSTHLLREFFDCANGCGAKGGQKFPHTIYGVDIESACIGHDLDWRIAENYKEVLQGNERFDNNLKKICDPQSNWFTRPLRRLRIAKFVSAVELYGTEEYANERGFIDGRL